MTVAREMVALANRDGGRIVVVVDRVGVFEAALAVDFATMTDVVTEIGRARVVPSMVADVELLGGAEGEVLVDHLARQGKTRVMINHRSFVITFSALPGGAGAGLGWPELEGARSSQTVWSRLHLAFNCLLPFPEQDRGADRAVEQFLEALVERLRTRWDGTRWLQSISPAYLSDFAHEVG